MGINISLQKTINRSFLTLLDDIKGNDKIELFLKDILGDDEYKELVKKLAVVYWLRKNRPDDIIKNNLDVDDKYIAGTKPLMNKPGIKLAIKYMEAEEFANVWSEKFQSISKKAKSRI